MSDGLGKQTDFALVGGRLLSMAGEPIDDATVIIRGGKILAAGRRTKTKIPRGLANVDAKGKWILPGFVEPHAHLGVHEEGEGWAGDDTNEMTDPNGARLRALDAINPDDEGLRDALSGGITTAVVKPGSGNPIGGQTVAIKTWGRIVDEMVLKEPCSVKSALGENPKRVYGEKKALPSTRLGVAAVIRDALTDAREYADARMRKNSTEKYDPTKETLARVLSGELPWCQHTHRVDDIATAIRLSEEFGYRLVINHGTEAHLIASFIAEKQIPVVIGPLFTSRSKVEVRRRSLKNPGHLQKAGVKIALTTDHPVVPIEFLVYQAALAVKEGLDRDEALKSLTINPAEMLGLDDRVGSLEPGKDADIALWSGDPLDVYSRCEKVWIDGRNVYEYDYERDLPVTAKQFENS
ncbi:imidazolonepropionase-like amidohydrolase [Antricoccus suffuscus]|uniref:Imidazolonepropionase-like amidohydrolase n=1 Tax=Antricoccus suffuscus TaxID=1629062 RepID=A0A2T1A3H1_9ACTN|nr:amidohydrolase [Antricoccus suffuscus]PRZ43155.1 imidazolonepropionase-like amidohydrolase [Antricoccus suffuscus]